MAERSLASTGAPISVGQLTRYIKYLVSRDELLSALAVQGEVCDLSKSSAGHVYFAIRDASSQVSCVLFRKEALQQQETLSRLQKGVSVVVHGYLSIYEQRGTFQIFVQRVQVEGAGTFQQRFERLKARLEQDGLFSPGRKRTPPQFPEKVALITAPDGQAYHDVVRRLRDQYPFARVIVAPVAVQGEGAADEASLAIDIVNRLTDADVILLVRGGGSPEDLASFNDERLARAIFASRIPVITGIGHEKDQTIADLVADRCASTPTAAAAAAVPDALALVKRVRALHDQLAVAMTQRLRAARSGLVEQRRAVSRASPQNRLSAHRQRSTQLSAAGRRAIRQHLQTSRQRLLALDGQLRALDPLAILGRGYAMLSDAESGHVVSKVEHARAGASLRARVSDGEFLVRVEDTSQ